MKPYTIVPRSCSGVAVFLLLIANLIYPSVVFSQESRSVLYINSYHDGYRWSDGISRGLRKGLSEGAYKIDLQIEYMDAKKFGEQNFLDKLLVLYEEKFNREKFDAIVVSDDDAFNFALEHRALLFPDTPLIFCGVNSLTQEELNSGNVTGIVENFDFQGTIDVALKLHSAKSRMVVVGDDSTTSVAIRNRIADLVPLYRGRLEVDYWTNRSFDEVLAGVQELPEDTFLFFIPYYQVLGDLFFTAEEVAAAIYERSSVPIYSSWSFLVGNGVVGGNVISGFDHGRRAASMVLEALSGTHADLIPVRLEVQGEYVFDYKVMKRLDLSMDSLPRKSKIINAPISSYEVNREVFWVIIVAVCLLLIIICFLGLSMMARRDGERRLKDQLAFQEILIDTVPQLVSWKDVNGRYMGGNVSYAEFFGLVEKSEVVNESTKEIVFDARYAQWSIDADRQVVERQCEYRRVRKKIHNSSGSVFWLEVNKVPLRDQKNNVTGILTTAEDITREQNLENQLLQSQKIEAIGTLAGGIAHDFNNILTSIINSTELAITDVPSGSQTEKDLERVLKAALRGGHLVKQILAFSKPTQEGFVPTDLGAVVTEVLQLIEVSTPRNVIVRSNIDTNIESIHADPTQLHQVVMNLCTNAFQALKERGGELHVRLDKTELSAEEAVILDIKKGEYLRLAITDDGIGIPREVVDKIFEPFFSLKEKSEGTGLGLAVVHGIVKGHDGGIRVSSELGVGTVFEIFIPYIAVGRESSIRMRDEEYQSGGRILFVEDDREQLITAPRLIRSFGYDVDPVSDPEVAIEKIAENPDYYDLVITDYDMPKLNGIEMVQKISLWAPALPAMIISGGEEVVHAANGCSSIKKIIPKPYHKDQIYDGIVSVLEEKETTGVSL